MAIERKYAKQFPFVGTLTQRAMIEKEADRRRTSLAGVVRAAVDKYFGLVDGEQPEPGEPGTQEGPQD